MKDFDPDFPVVLGFAGGYCTGKTTTANIIAPAARMVMGSPGGVPIVWDHLYYALPLYRMARARQSIEGDLAYDRVLYEIHNTLLEVFGYNPLYGAPKYDDLIQMVYEIAEYPCPPEDVKPREFLQYVGTEIVRAYDDDAWVKWMDRKIKDDHRKFLWDHRNFEDENPDSIPFPIYGVVVSDCRFKNEAKLIKDHPNGVLVKFTVDPEVAQQRQEKRDGYSMTTSEKNHKSEQSVTHIPDDWYTAVIDSTHMSPQQQADAVMALTKNSTGALNA